MQASTLPRGARVQSRANTAQHGAPLRFPSVRVASAATSQYTLLPANVQEQVDACAAAISAASSSKRHIVELINPVNEKAISFLSTEAMDYPCATFTEFNSIVGLTKNLVARLLGNGDATLNTMRIDEGGIDGDLCAVVSSSGLEVVAVVWPTAGRLKSLKKYAEDARVGTLIIVNPLWKTQGQLVSEFGIGPWRKANEEFLATFEQSYFLVEQRIGAPSSVNLASGGRYEDGGVVRTQRAFPGPFESHLMAPNGVSQALGAFPVSGGRPTYNQLDALIRQARKAKLDIFDVARQASSLAIERGDAPTDNNQESESLGEDGPAASAFYSRDQVLDMDLSKLRRVLMPLGLPTSGAISKLQARALAVADSVSAGGDLEASVEAAKALR
ncbi:hypothetical protein FOA52_008824 [Chlamydomonas sp. UWO 241]|nr:hypothetical protein FOA52_008824 [Chlamydomonas sp. UWO 241]